MRLQLRLNNEIVNRIKGLMSFSPLQSACLLISGYKVRVLAGAFKTAEMTRVCDGLPKRRCGSFLLGPTPVLPKHRFLPNSSVT